MIIPEPWVGLLLGLAAYRLTRLGGWDDWPPIYRVRAWLIGERWLPEEGEVSLPGKTPDSEVSGVRPAFDRPLLAHLVHCPFCLGWWVSLAVYLCWHFFPTEALYVAAPFALSAFVGLVSKNLDA